MGRDGYEVNLCEPLVSRYQCPLCRNLMRNPLQTFRGELACEYCYRQAMRDGICPIDGEPIKRDELFIDKHKTKEIELLRCTCLNREYGCQWEGTVSTVEDHQEKCDYKPVECYLCQEKIYQLDMNSHIQVCKMLPKEGKCVYPECPFKPGNVEELRTHIEKAVVYHAMIHSSTIEDMQLQLRSQYELEQKQSKEKERNMEEEMKKLMEQVTTFIENTNQIQNESKRKISILQKKLTELENKPISINNPVTDETSDSQLMDISGKVNALNQNVSDLNLRQQLYENTSYDGKLLWKIDNVSMRLNQAVIGKVTALHSAPTFTSRYGYKFCGRLYLNGDGVGKGTHMSMFFVLMKSEYDNLLEWPFSKLVTMRLINQDDSDNDIVEHFNADVNSTSFTKPQKDMNIASGCPLFTTNEKFLNGGYIKDDTMFIELSVLDGQVTTNY